MGQLLTWMVILVTGYLSTTIAEKIACKDLKSIINTAKSLIRCDECRSNQLENAGYTYLDNIFGAASTPDCCGATEGDNSRLHTVAAQIYMKDHNRCIEDFKEAVIRCNAFGKVPGHCFHKPRKAPKYRPIDGRGNNIKHPEYGASNTPFARFTPKGYEDGVYSVKKSVTGADLPNPRDIVQNVLKKAVGVSPPPLSFCVFALMTVLFITHDVHYQTPIQPSNNKYEINCCLDDNSGPLPACVSNSACMPISISKNDSFYSSGNIGCINLVRSQTGEYAEQAQPGEIMNRATSFLDLSLIYGNHESELHQVRLYKDGLLRMRENGLLPCDSNGQYIGAMKRFTMVPLASIWPSIFSRNHNTVAKGLKKLNPQWDDETLFQESRRINIASFQYNLITSIAVDDAISGIPINETYDPTRNAAVSLEFAISYRTAHYYINDNMLFIDEEGNTSTMKQSDTIGHIEILEDNFDEALRGALNQVINTGQYGDEITNRIGKNNAGYGKDIVSIDIQRGRDQGLPSFLDVRRQCGLKPEVNSFDDLNKIFNATNVELLRNAYADVNDIDFYVGEMFEIFEINGNPLGGPTLNCVIASQWSNLAGGDLYYYLNPSSPYPFTQSQIKAIQEYSISNLLCANSGMSQTAAMWPYAPSEVNPLTNCSSWPPMDLTAWKV